MKASLQDLYLEAFLRMRNSGILTWTTRDGKVIAIKDMTDKHLVNTIKMLERDLDTFSNEGPDIGDGPDDLL